MRVRSVPVRPATGSEARKARRPSACASPRAAGRPGAGWCGWRGRARSRRRPRVRARGRQLARHARRPRAVVPAPPTLRAEVLEQRLGVEVVRRDVGERDQRAQRDDATWRGRGAGRRGGADRRAATFTPSAAQLVRQRAGGEAAGRLRRARARARGRRVSAPSTAAHVGVVAPAGAGTSRAGRRSARRRRRSRPARG